MFLPDLKTGIFIGQRHLQIFLLFSSIVVNYFARYSIGIAVVSIAEEAKTNPNNTNWTEMQKSYVISSFFWGYCLTQFLGGYLCRLLGVKQTMLISTLGSAAFAIVPTFFDASWIFFCLVRTVQGLFQGFLFPCIYSHLGVWSPKNEHNRLGAITNSGMDFGIIVSMYLSGIIAASSLGWAGISYLATGLGLTWCLLWFVFAANSPSESRFISKSELAYIESSKSAAQDSTSDANERNEEKIPVPWKAILTSMPFLALIVVRAGESWGLNTLIAEMPSYMSGVVGVEMKTNALFSALPYMIMLCMSYVFLISSDVLMKHRVVTLSTLRKATNSLAFFVPAIGLFAVGFVEPEQKTLIVLLFMTSLGFNAGHTLGSGLNTLDLSPNHVGILMGIKNTISNIIPIVTPLVVGFIVHDVTDRNQWQLVFIITSVIYILSNIFYLIYGTAELQPWNDRDFLTKNDMQSKNTIAVDKDNSTTNQLEKYLHRGEQ